MARPALVAIDDDPEVLRAVTRDLKRHYGERYRVLQADSGSAALELVQQLRVRNEPVALFLSDQRMARMTGTELLERVGDLVPTAKRILLTAYADTEAAIDAINRARVDFYLLKPWHPPEEKLFPALDEFLDDWEAAFKPPFEGVRLLAYRWSASAHALKGFMARNQIPYEWLDVEGRTGVRRLLEDAGVTESDLPVVILPDGGVLPNATAHQVAERVGLRTRAQAPFYDLIIAGAGPAGLAAAVYGGSEGLRTLLVEREAPGGQAGESSRIENYLGFPAGLSGAELARRAATQARRFGTDILVPQEVAGVRVDGPYRILELADGSEVSCHALIIATGVSYRRLEVPGLAELTGAGVYYGAAATEAANVRDHDVYVVGGGNSAGQAAMYFARFARRVVVLIRGPSLDATMSRYLIDQIAATPAITVRPGIHVIAAEGDGHLQRLVLAHVTSGTTETVEAAGLFIFIGARPRTDWLEGVLRRDERGFIPTGTDLAGDDGTVPRWPLQRPPYLLETSVPGVFAAGDVRRGSVKRVASGVGEGAMAVSLVHQYLATL